MADPTGGAGGRPIRTLLGPLGISATGMARQQRFIDVITRNIANADVTRTAEGGPYQRQMAIATIDPVTGAPTTQVITDTSPGRLVYNPSHPDANADGYVEYPNVDLAYETVDLMLARRMHDANVSVFQAAKAMLRRALDL